MILYELGKSRSLRGHWVLKEAGVEYETVTIQLREGEGQSPEYLKLNPFGKVPCLKDGDHVVFESLAIVNYIASQKPEKNLIPTDVKGRSLYDQWTSVCLHEFEAPLWLFARQGWFFPKEWDSDDIEKYSKVDSQRALKVIEPLLGEREYFLGHFSGVDIMWGYALNWSVRYGWLEEFPNCRAYLDRLKARPSCPLPS